MAKKLSKLATPLHIEREYQKDIRAITTKVRDLIDRNIVAALPAIMAEVEALRPRADKFDEDVSQKVADLFEATRIELDAELTNFDIERTTQASAASINTWNKTQVTRVFKQGLGVNILFSEPWLAEEMRIFNINNVNLIKSNNNVFLNQTEGIVYDGMRRGLRHEQIAQQILGTGKDELGKVSRFRQAKTRANLIGRDQTNKFNGQLNQLRQVGAGVKKYIWRTTLDGRERPHHHDYDGNKFTWVTGSPIGTHPGDEIQCRCYPEPDLSDLLK